MAAVPETVDSIRTVFDDGAMECHKAAGNLHRIDGPAIRCANGDKSWWLYGKCHRLTGPAIESTNDTKWWFVAGKKVSESEFPAAVAAYCESHPNCPSVAYYMSVTGRFKKPSRSA